MPRADAARLIAAAVLGLALCGRVAVAAPACLYGVNLSGPEFGTVPGRFGFDYLYPSPATFTRVAELGATALRLPVRWERLQPELRRPLDPAELLRLDAAVVSAKLAGLRTVIDIHNFAYHGKTRIGTEPVTNAAFADLWRRLAGHFRSEPSVAFGLMNEPYDISAADWLKAAQAGIAAIREAGASQLVLVPGTAWTGVHSWESDLPVGNNAAVMLGLIDPLDNFAYDVHQYLDADFSGTSAACGRADDALKAVERMTDWLARNRRRAYLGEVGASAAKGCPERLAAILAHVNARPDQWVGWAVWGAGEMWPPAYPLRVDVADAGAPVPNAIRVAAGAAPRCGRRP